MSDRVTRFHQTLGLHEHDDASIAIAVGVAVRRLRLARSLTQEELGRAAGIHPAQVNRLEAGARVPKLGTLLRVTRGLGITFEHLGRELDAAWSE